MTPAVLPDTTWTQFRRAVMTFRAGSTLTVDDVRQELYDAGIPPLAFGSLFRTACERGLLSTDGLTRPSTDPLARGRRILIYRRLPVAQRKPPGNGVRSSRALEKAHPRRGNAGGTSPNHPIPMDGAS